MIEIGSYNQTTKDNRHCLFGLRIQSKKTEFTFFFVVLLEQWPRENIVTDRKKAPNLAEKSFVVKQTNLEGVTSDPIIRGGIKRDLLFTAFI